MNNYFEEILKQYDMSETEVNQLSPLVLAYIGDTVYEVFIRTMLVHDESVPVHKLHTKSIAYVKAKAQSDIVHAINDELTQEEQDVVRRGRNAKSGTIPKNADVTEYKYATGFESLIGYLYLTKNFKRLMEILNLAITKSKSKI